MQLTATSLTGHLAKHGLLPHYVLHGDEPLLLDEARLAIKAAATEQGYEHQLLDASDKGFDWNELFHTTASIGMFSSNKLIEIRLPSGKPGQAGSKALCEYIDRNDDQNSVLLVTGKLDRSALSGKWFLAFGKRGGAVKVEPVPPHRLPQWLSERGRQAGLRITDDALLLLSDRVEGNLLAARGELEKLALLSPDGNIGVNEIGDAVLSSARYDLFELADSALAGDANRGIKILNGLRSEGTELTLILWAVVREIRQIHTIVQLCEAGVERNQAMRQMGIWQSKFGLMGKALNRHTPASTKTLLLLASRADRASKGASRENPWDILEALITKLALAKQYTSPEPRQYSQG